MLRLAETTLSAGRRVGWRLAFLAAVIVVFIPASAAADSAVTEFGADQGVHYLGLAIGQGGSVYIAGTLGSPPTTCSVLEFSADGQLVRRWELACGSTITAAPFGLQGLATDASGNVYVAAPRSGAVEIFDPAGNFLRSISAMDPAGLGVGPDGSVYLVDNNRVRKFASNGTLSTTWGSGGSGDGQFNFGFDPISTAIGGGHVYVPDYGNTRIQRFDEAGTFETKWSLPNGSKPVGVALDPSGNVFVTSFDAPNSVYEYDPSGTLLGTAHVPGAIHLEGLAVAPSGLVYAASLVTDSASGLGAGFRIDPSVPSAALASVGPVLTGDQVTFDASKSEVPFGHVADYSWDLGSGSFNTDTGASPNATTTFSQVGQKTVSVRVTAPSGKTDIASTQVDVRPAPPPGDVGVSINDGDYATNTPNVQLYPVWPAFSSVAKISNDGGFGPAGGTTTKPLDATIPWALSSQSSERLPKIVYLRFPDSASPTETFTDDIILDTTTPVIDSASSAGGTGPSIAAKVADVKKRRFRVRLHATEKLSGISAAQFAKKKSKGTTVVLKNRKRRGITKLSKVVSVKMTAKPRYVRVRSAAGNWSKWHRIG